MHSCLANLITVEAWAHTPAIKVSRLVDLETTPSLPGQVRLTVGSKHCPTSKVVAELFAVETLRLDTQPQIRTN